MSGLQRSLRLISVHAARFRPGCPHYGQPVRFHRSPSAPFPGSAHERVCHIGWLRLTGPNVRRLRIPCRGSARRRRHALCGALSTAPHRSGRQVPSRNSLSAACGCRGGRGMAHRAIRFSALSRVDEVSMAPSGNETNGLRLCGPVTGRGRLVGVTACQSAACVGRIG
jgi:hypothetical protein